ncbi:hypothetical protein AB0G74_08750 [Streptomyces sp. NPDC020875]|uniref:hypothetical protein n=1 Tax=Streptomyces sp. NPDC020875 TaxID=3154898 RepID=UPI0033C5F8E9
MSSASIRPVSPSCQTAPASTRSRTGFPVARSTGSRAPASPMIGVPVVALAAELSESVAASSSSP